MAHERETWLDHGVAELLLRGRPVGTTGEHAQAQADRLARALEEAVPVAYADSAELPGEAAALAAFRQSVGTTAGPAGARSWDADDAGIGTVRLAPERRGIRLPSVGRPLRLGMAAAMAGCALSGVAAGAGFLYAPSAGESPPRPSNSISDALTPAPLVSESPSSSLNTPPLSSDPGAGTDSDSPGASSGAMTGDPVDKGRKSQGTGNGWKKGGGEKWYAKLVQACQEYRNGTISAGKRKLLEDAAKGPQGVNRLCNQLLSGDGRHDGAQGTGGSSGSGGSSSGGGSNGGSSGGSSGGGGVDGPQSSGPIEGPVEGVTPSETGGGTGGGSDGPSSEWPGGEYGETIGMYPPESDASSLPPQLPASPSSETSSQASPETSPAPSES
ncbi:hypothetical protein OG211_24170 [Streptomyces niveus]|uniref:hypothetical protein n=1 Tax=Streptomyces niveus TaxID=193462 RepID=UPI00386A44D8|nr:hypothetical protein OG211_24170 [Streptomyces niveus]